jgi:hypothetical protein
MKNGGEINLYTTLLICGARVSENSCKPHRTEAHSCVRVTSKPHPEAGMAPKRTAVQKTWAPERTGPTVVLATNPRAKAGSDDIAAMLCCSKGNVVTFPQHSLVSLPNRPSCASRLRSRSIATLPRSLASNTLYPPRFHSCPARGTRAHPHSHRRPAPGARALSAEIPIRRRREAGTGARRR